MKGEKQENDKIVEVLIDQAMKLYKGDNSKETFQE